MSYYAISGLGAVNVSAMPRTVSMAMTPVAPPIGVIVPVPVPATAVAATGGSPYVLVAGALVLAGYLAYRHFKKKDPTP